MLEASFSYMFSSVGIWSLLAIGIATSVVSIYAGTNTACNLSHDPRENVRDKVEGLKGVWSMVYGVWCMVYNYSVWYSVWYGVCCPAFPVPALAE